MITTLKTKTTQEDVYPNIQSSNIPNNAVTSAKIVSAAVSSAKIATSAVTDTKIATGAVTETKIATGAVTQTKIADGAVTDTKIATGAVTNDKIVSVNGTKVYDDSVQVQKLQLRRYAFDKSYTQLTFSQLATAIQTIFRDGQVLETYREDYGETPYDTHYELSIGYSATQGEIYIRFDGTTNTIDGDASLTTFLNGVGTDFTFFIIYIDGLKDIQ